MLDKIQAIVDKSIDARNSGFDQTYIHVVAEVHAIFNADLARRDLSLEGIAREPLSMWWNGEMVNKGLLADGLMGTSLFISLGFLTYPPAICTWYRLDGQGGARGRRQRVEESSVRELVKTVLALCTFE